MTNPPVAEATVKLKTLNYPHPAVPGGEVGAENETKLREGVTYEIAFQDKITQAAAEAFYDARITAGDWVVVPFVRSVPFGGRTPIKPIAQP